MSHAARISLLFGLLLFAGRLSAEPKLVVHEWGTFTCLQDENGQAIGGINTDDEPVPSFVYDLCPQVLFPIEEPAANSKGVRRCNSDITMRLETPVIYFYPNEEFHEPLHVQVSASQTWLTQFFPKAAGRAFALRADGTGFLRHGNSRLEWDNIQLVTSDQGPATNSLVWTTPRQVDAATVELNGEHEKFLFYRGVCHRESPVQVVRKGPEFVITRTGTKHRPDEIHELWLANMDGHGGGSFRVLRPFTEETAFVVKTPVAFTPEESADDAVEQLKAVMRQALIEAGLFEKEADAMLNTWDQSYFRSAGLRLFFLVPRRWTDEALPLRVSLQGEAHQKEQDLTFRPELTRAMIGRIEIVTPAQRKMFADFVERFGAKPGKESSAPAGPARFPWIWDNFFKEYQQLGRFRNALVLDEEKRRPGPLLEQFIQRYQLHGYDPDYQHPSLDRVEVVRGP